MFNKKLKNQIKEKDELIKSLREELEIKKSLEPALTKIEKAVNKWEKDLYKVIENEANYIHAYFKTIIGMVNKDKLDIIKDLKKEVEKASKLYIKKFIKD